ncbi:hypothetical protein CPG38_06695 [Malaciobacter marinus]|uniref:glycine zipper 2TM domain-containing protein n=1 Tax=Malaciobacter marinus TaxID=505249 RepID=UPI000C08AB7A|nr:glycine zipper 2TM domain-containing protein [Malaciobacter marinus]PHO12635.1 hypothetical protein CPG38_06695 [Malaciobacter marinus]
MKKLIILIVLFTSLLFANKTQNLYDFIDVDYSEVIYKYITVKEPIQECYEQEYKQRVDINSSYDNNSIGLDTIIGATAGVVIGNQIGKGNGNTAAKIVGGLLGGKIANEIRGSNSDDYYYETKTRTKCVTKYINATRKKIIQGYKNHFTYDGIKYVKVTKKPQEQIKVTKIISY